MARTRSSTVAGAARGARTSTRAPTQPRATTRAPVGRPPATRQATTIPPVSTDIPSAPIPPVLPTAIPGPTVSVPVDVYLRMMGMTGSQAPAMGAVSVPIAAPQSATPATSTPTTEATPVIQPSTPVADPIIQPAAMAPQAGIYLGQSSSTPPMGDEVVAKRIESFMKLQPPEFDGTAATCTAQRYIQKCEKIFAVLGTRDTLGVRCASFRLSGDAETWWASITRQRSADLPPITWAEFVAMFMSRFVPQSDLDARRREFESLRQGSMSVSAYDTRFLELSQYAPAMVALERDRVLRFVEGLHPRLQIAVAPNMGGKSYYDVVDIARRMEDIHARADAERSSKRLRYSGISSGPSYEGQGYRGPTQSRPQAAALSPQGGSSGVQRPQPSQRRGDSSQSVLPVCGRCRQRHFGRCRPSSGRGGGSSKGCFECGDPGHFVRDCPYITSSGPISGHPGSSAMDPSFPQAARPISQVPLRSPVQRAPGSGGSAQVYAMMRQDVEASHDVVTGILSVCGRSASYLVDCGCMVPVGGVESLVDLILWDIRDRILSGGCDRLVIGDDGLLRRGG